MNNTMLVDHYTYADAFFNHLCVKGSNPPCHKDLEIISMPQNGADIFRMIPSGFAYATHLHTGIELKFTTKGDILLVSCSWKRNGVELLGENFAQQPLPWLQACSYFRKILKWTDIIVVGKIPNCLNQNFNPQELCDYIRQARSFIASTQKFLQSGSLNIIS